ncbi:MAG: Glu/Leu/Phe/Val dehydrogenase [Planctomycetes bacterium]|nr:Glu/Leu/Phe/Val dehydrogenase [Planctomycetota bacterium]
MRIRTIDVEGFEQVIRGEDLPGGHTAFIAIHSTALGPSLGGLRMWAYGREEDALADVLRLAEAMTWKAAAAGLPLGGGKAVVIGDARRDKTPALLEGIGEFVEEAEGRYITAEDVGIGADDLIRIRARTRHVTGLPLAEGGSGDPSPFTARGVLRSIEVCLERLFGRADVRGRTVAIQGAGHVGLELAKLLAAGGARILVSDIVPERAARCAVDAGGRVLPPEEILSAACDVLAPCALGGVIDEGTIESIRAPIIAGGANNQLATLEMGDRLVEQDILYAPDFVANAGGLINISVELEPEGYREARAIEKVDRIADSMRDVFAVADREKISPARAALRMAEETVRQAEAEPQL